MKSATTQLCATEGCIEDKVGKSKYCAKHRAIARQEWLAKIKASDAERKAKTARWEKLHADAHAAGLAAAEAHVPTPMVVQQHANQLDDSSPVVQQWVVEGGLCGFAWVVVRPGTCSFARWLKKNVRGADKHYYGGVSVWCPLGTQSMSTKEAYCNAYSRVLRDAGINATAGSRLD